MRLIFTTILNNMFPSFKANNRPNSWRGYIEPFGYFCLFEPFFVQRSYFPNVVILQFRNRPMYSLGHPALFIRIIYVLLLSAKKKMFRVYASSIITFMTHFQTFFKISKMQKVRKSVCIFIFKFFVELTVPDIADITCPIPAAFSFFNFTPKSFSGVGAGIKTLSTTILRTFFKSTFVCSKFFTTNSAISINFHSVNLLKINEKRLIITSLSLFLFSVAYGQTKYYVSNSGSDANNGLTTATSWQTLHKVNVSTFSNGDSILFKRGDVWNDSLIINHGQLNFGAYGTGIKPEITGFQSATMTSAGSNIWTGTLTNAPNHYFDTSTNGIGTVLKSSMNGVQINGQYQSKARYPNIGQAVTPDFGQGSFLSSANYSYSGQWIKSDQALTRSYVGAEIVAQPHPWEYDVSLVTKQSGDTVWYSPTFSYSLNARGRFFLQNLPSLLDVQGEWCYNDTTKLLSVYSTTSPIVQYPTIDTLVNVHKHDSISFNNIKFSGSNRESIEADSSNNLTFISCTFSFNGFNGVRGWNCNNWTFSKDSVLNSLSNGIAVFGKGLTVDSCYVYNSGTIFGVGGAGNGQNFGIKQFSVGGTANVSITNNRVILSGYSGIDLAGSVGTCYRNFVDSFCIITSDGGGIAFAGGTPTSNILVRSNICLNGIGDLNDAPGLYFDNCSNFTVDSNTISRGYIYGILVGSSSNYTLSNNLVIDSTGHPLAFLGSTGTKTGNYNHNTFFLRNTAWYGVYSSTSILNNVDTNTYLIPIADTSIFYTVGDSKKYNLQAWQNATGLDLHSSNSYPAHTASVSNYQLVYNDKATDSTVSISGLWVDAKGAEHNNSISLTPFQSALLFKSDHEIPVPSEPTIGKKIGNLIFK